MPGKSSKYEVFRYTGEVVWTGSATSPDVAMRKFHKAAGISGPLYTGAYGVRRVGKAKANPRRKRNFGTGGLGQGGFLGSDTVEALRGGYRNSMLGTSGYRVGGSGREEDYFAREQERALARLRAQRRNPTSSWWSAGNDWLQKAAAREAAAQKRAHIKAGRSPNTFRYSPPEWHRDMVEALGRNDEEMFKHLKGIQVLYQPNPKKKTSARKKNPSTRRTPFHVYGPSGFESAHSTRGAAEKAARKYAHRRKAPFKVVETGAMGHSGGGQGHAVFTAYPKGSR